LRGNADAGFWGGADKPKLRWVGVPEGLQPVAGRGKRVTCFDVTL